MAWLIGCLAEKWPSVKRFAAEQLKIVKDPKSVPALLEASRDEDVEVQLAVFEAMGPFASENEDVRARMLEAIGYGDISVRQAVVRGWRDQVALVRSGCQSLFC